MLEFVLDYPGYSLRADGVEFARVEIRTTGWYGNTVARPFLSSDSSLGTVIGELAWMAGVCDDRAAARRLGNEVAARWACTPSTTLHHRPSRATHLVEGRVL